MMRILLISVLLYVVNTFVYAEKLTDAPYVTKSFLIVKSTKSYKEATAFAQTLADKSSIRLNLRGLQPHKQEGLSESKKSCLSQGFTYPCYIARGRWDDGIYISVEHSDYYEGFRHGYYLVMLASMEHIDKALLDRVRRMVPDAYVKRSMVFMGCMH